MQLLRGRLLAKSQLYNFVYCSVPGSSPLSPFSGHICEFVYEEHPDHKQKSQSSNTYTDTDDHLKQCPCRERLYLRLQHCIEMKYDRFIFLILVCLHTALGSPVNTPSNNFTAIACKTLYTKLSDVIQLHTGSQPNLNPTCDERLLKLFHRYMLHSDNNTFFEDGNLLIPKEYLNDERISSWLVWAFIGKNFVKQDTERQHVFFEFDEVSSSHSQFDRLTRIMANCEFQQVLYLTLIVILILILMAVLVWPQLEKLTSNDTELKEYSDNGKEPNGDKKENRIDGKRQIRFRLPVRL